ncbi:MAG: hypothetical protein QOJ99_2323 [Bryobacterales bacterium]|nr:hypothetical protein [Bryobacterales bacterium]
MREAIVNKTSTAAARRAYCGTLATTSQSPDDRARRSSSSYDLDRMGFAASAFAATRIGVIFLLLIHPPRCGLLYYWLHDFVLTDINGPHTAGVIAII